MILLVKMNIVIKATYVILFSKDKKQKQEYYRSLSSDDRGLLREFMLDYHYHRYLKL